ncbi:hypothetical protein [Pseudoduganella sp.]|uniref:hypothetical protein n=1 Tax=Pseudoduganella sp. TaxID=1880898 RepID=UPI0035AEE1C9
MKHAIVILACAIGAACTLCGCAAPKPLTAETARKALTIGTSTKADVKEAIGSASVSSFASGYEVWVYNYKAGLPAFTQLVPVLGEIASLTDALARERELVILFDKEGIVRKVRMREGESKLVTNLL